uniref:HEAT repeat-containing protein 1 n=1 Tax=Albugo laibachii Nc14 TaxID=890382 RepID=F0WXE2_9STRA|nr:conserved hypothetical protein [Albugo laibachii Nc14]|eukprot:CCA26134.1 conserved hypothetical protein [Albugo laibachii Nc14]
MSSSLALQLQSLREKGAGSKRRIVSFLYDHREAAQLDDEMIYNMACNGLIELQKIDARFDTFLEDPSKTQKNSKFSVSDLFSRQKVHFRRAHLTPVEDSQLSAHLRIVIDALSGYFLLNATHKVLEFLIWRYEIHRFNVDDVMTMIICYHESPFFARMFRLLHIRDTRWEFLLSVKTQKRSSSAEHEIMVVRDVLVQRALDDTSLIEFIFDAMYPSSTESTQQGINDSNSFSQALLPSNHMKLISLYTAVVVGVVERAHVISETLFRKILPQLLRTCAAVQSPDIQISGYMILTKLASRATLAAPTLSALVKQIVKHIPRTSSNHHNTLHNGSGSTSFHAILCLMHLSQTQPLLILDKRVAKYFAQIPDLGSILCSAADSYDISKLARSILFEFITNISGSTIKDSSRKRDLYYESAKCLMESLPESTMSVIMGDLVEKLFDEAEQADYDMSCGKAASVSLLIQVLSRKYMEEVEKVVQTLLHDKGNPVCSDQSNSVRSKRRSGKNVLRDAFLSATFTKIPNSSRFLPFHISTSEKEEVQITSLALALDHPSAKARLQAIKALESKVAETKQSDLSTLKDIFSAGDVLLRRLQDDCLDIVHQLVSSKTLSGLLLRTCASKSVYLALSSTLKRFLSSDSIEKFSLEWSKKTTTEKQPADHSDLPKALLIFLVQDFAPYTGHRYDEYIFQYLLCLIANIHYKYTFANPNDGSRKLCDDASRSFVDQVVDLTSQLEHPLSSALKLWQDEGKPGSENWIRLTQLIGRILVKDVENILPHCLSWGHTEATIDDLGLAFDAAPSPMLLIETLECSRRQDTLSDAGMAALDRAFQDVLFKQFIHICTSKPDTDGNGPLTFIVKFICNLAADHSGGNVKAAKNRFESCLMVLSSAPAATYSLIERQVYNFLKQYKGFEAAPIIAIPRISFKSGALVSSLHQIGIELDEDDERILVSVVRKRCLDFIRNAFENADASTSFTMLESTNALPIALVALVDEEGCIRQSAITCLEQWIKYCSSKSSTTATIGTFQTAITYLLEAKQDILLDSTSAKRILRSFHTADKTKARQLYSLILQSVYSNTPDEFKASAKMLELLKEVELESLWLETSDFFQQTLAGLSHITDQDSTDIVGVLAELLTHYMRVSNKRQLPKQFSNAALAVVKADTKHRPFADIQNAALDLFVPSLFHLLSASTQLALVKALLELLYQSEHGSLTTKALGVLQQWPLSSSIYRDLFNEFSAAGGSHLGHIECLLEILSHQLVNHQGESDMKMIRSMFGILRDLLTSIFTSPDMHTSPSQYLFQILFICLRHLCEKSGPISPADNVNEIVEMKKVKGKPRKNAMLDVSREAQDLVGFTLQCLGREDTSIQTRNDALLFVGALVNVDPASVLRSLSSILQPAHEADARDMKSNHVPDDYSFHVIETIITFVTPHVVKNAAALLPRNGVRAITIVDYIRLFADNYEGLPSFRRRQLFKTLARCLGKDFVSEVVVILIEHAIHVNVEVNFSDLLQDAHALLRDWDLEDQIESLRTVLGFCKQLLRQLTESTNEEGRSQDWKENDLEDEPKSAKIMTFLTASSEQARVLEQTLVDFVLVHLADEKILALTGQTRSSSEDDEEGLENGHTLQRQYLQLAQATLLFYRRVTRHEVCARDATSKVFWANFGNTLMEIVSALQNLLSTPSFLALIGELLHHDNSLVRKKAMQLFNARLEEQRNELAPIEELLYMEMIPELNEFLQTKPSEAPSDKNQSMTSSIEAWANIQVALLSLDILARNFASKSQYQQNFGCVLESIVSFLEVDFEYLVNNAKKCSQHIQVIGCAFVCLGSICEKIGPLVVPFLPKFFPQLLIGVETSELKLRETNSSSGLQLFLECLLRALQIFTSKVARFVTPYLAKTIQCLLLPSLLDTSSFYSDSTKIVLDSAFRNIINNVELRHVIPALTGPVLQASIASSSDAALLKLLSMMSTIVTELPTSSVRQHLPLLARFYVSVMDLRRLDDLHTINLDDLVLLEDETLECLVHFVLKLNEKQLKPFLLKLVEWTQSGSGMSRRITFFRLLSKLTEHLQGIIVPYFGHTWQMLNSTLQETLAILKLKHSLEENNSESEDEFFASGEASKPIATKKAKLSNGVITTASSSATDNSGKDELLREQCLLVLQRATEAFHGCFVHDQEQAFVTPDRFHTIMTSLVDTFDILTVSDSTTSIQKRKDVVYGSVVPCIVHLAWAVKDDLLWKPLHYAVLLKSRSRHASVRLASLKTIEKCYQIIGDEFLVMLPESLPFLSELLEDNDMEVEKTCHHVIKQIEEISGESLDQYLVT